MSLTQQFVNMAILTCLGLCWQCCKNLCLHTVDGIKRIGCTGGVSSPLSHGPHHFQSCLAQCMANGQPGWCDRRQRFMHGHSMEEISCWELHQQSFWRCWEPWGRGGGRNTLCPLALVPCLWSQIHNWLGSDVQSMDSWTKCNWMQGALGERSEGVSSSPTTPNTSEHIEGEELLLELLLLNSHASTSLEVAKSCLFHWQHAWRWSRKQGGGKRRTQPHPGRGGDEKHPFSLLARHSISRPGEGHLMGLSGPSVTWCWGFATDEGFFQVSFSWPCASLVVLCWIHGKLWKAR